MRSKRYFWHAGQAAIVACLVSWISAVVGQVTQVTPNAPDNTDWQKNFIDGPSTNQAPVRTTLACLTSTRDHLVGEFHVTNLSGTAVAMTGKESEDGKFWPDVVPEVTSGQVQADWKWKRLDPIVVKGKVATLTVAPQTLSKPVFVDMDIFKSEIGKEIYGRVVFSSGEWSMFELSDLSPTKK